MTITYPLTFPSGFSINDVQVRLYNVSTKNTSPFNLVTQVYDLGGERWEISGSLPPMNRPDAERYNSFILSLRGQVGTFLMSVPDAKEPQGSWSGTPLVDGANQTGDTLDVKGFAASQTGVVKAGDYFSLGTGSSTRLYKVVEDADSDASGDATLTIVPRLRNPAPANNAALTSSNAQGLFRLTNPRQGYDASPSSLYNISFQCEEVL